MSAPDPLAGTNEEFVASMWREWVASTRPSGPNMFSQDRGEAAVTGIIPASVVRGCMRYALGYNAVSASVLAPEMRLYRTNPCFHPRFPSLYCTSAAEEEYKPDGKFPITGNVKTEGSEPTPVGRENPHVLGSGYAPRAARARYALARVTLRFEPLPYLIAEDEDFARGFEYLRNTYIDQEPRAEILSLSGFNLTYAEGLGHAVLPAASQPLGKEYPAEIGQVVVKSDLRVIWEHVPSSWIFRSDTSKPTRMLFRLGTVNEGEFLGYEEGTLALMGVKLTRQPWGLYIPNPELLLPQETRQMYRVEFAMQYFNPTKGTSDAVQITDNLGHNCAPWRGEIIPLLVDTNAGRWFLASYDGQLPSARTVGQKKGANCMFQYTDFAKLFDAADNGEANGE
jgi:hypothetical protein